MFSRSRNQNNPAPYFRFGAEIGIMEVFMNSEWISIKDKLPDSSVGVIVWGGIEQDDYDIEIARFYDNSTPFGRRWVRCLDSAELCVTHWMPLPPTPAVDRRRWKDEYITGSIHYGPNGVLR